MDVQLFATVYSILDSLEHAYKVNLKIYRVLDSLEHVCIYMHNNVHKFKIYLMKEIIKEQITNVYSARHADLIRNIEFILVTSSTAAL